MYIYIYILFFRWRSWPFGMQDEFLQPLNLCSYSVSISVNKFFVEIWIHIYWFWQLKSFKRQKKKFFYRDRSAYAEYGYKSSSYSTLSYLDFVNGRSIADPSSRTWCWTGILIGLPILYRLLISFIRTQLLLLFACSFVPQAVFKEIASEVEALL